MSSTTHPIAPPPLVSTSASLGSLPGGGTHSWRVWAVYLPAGLGCCSFPLTSITRHSSCIWYVLPYFHCGETIQVPFGLGRSPLLTLFFFSDYWLKDIRNPKWLGRCPSFQLSGMSPVSPGRNTPTSGTKTSRPAEHELVGKEKKKKSRGLAAGSLGMRYHFHFHISILDLWILSNGRNYMLGTELSVFNLLENLGIPGCYHLAG